MVLASAVFASAMLVMPAPAHAQLVGTGAAGNSFPFGGPVVGAGTVYQQIYAASNFSGAGNLLSVSFFEDPQIAGALRPATVDLYVSTTTIGVNGLSISDFNSNRGANNMLFGTYALSGDAPTTLTFTGTPFFYDPLVGNLLLDFRFSNIGAPPADRASYKANSGDSNGAFSRAHDFGTQFVGWGLQTQFNFGATATVPEPATFALVGAGLLGLVGVRRRVRRG